MKKSEIVELVKEVITEVKEEKKLNLILEGVTKEDINAVHESEKPLVNEAVVSIIVGAVLAAPKLMEYLAQVVKFIVKIFRKLFKGGGESEEGENTVSNWIEKNGHTLHKKYIKIVMKVVKLFGVAKTVWKDKQSGKVDIKKLKLTAEVLLNVAIAIAGASAIGGAVSAFSSGSPIIGAIESGLGGIKGVELAAAVKSIGPKLVGV
tara:strand:- start:50 stop:667 length:618 start_codon:yes stop_codon:yes gene_type:complete